MKKNTNNENSAQVYPGGILSFLESLVRMRKHEFQKESSEDQITFQDFENLVNFETAKQLVTERIAENQPLVRIKIRMRE